MIKEFVEASAALNESYLPIYNTPEGLKVYNDTLEVVTKSFPQYIRELQGTADGAQVEFHKVSWWNKKTKANSGQNFLLAISFPSRRNNAERRDAKKLRRGTDWLLNCLR